MRACFLALCDLIFDNCFCAITSFYFRMSVWVLFLWSLRWSFVVLGCKNVWSLGFCFIISADFSEMIGCWFLIVLLRALIRSRNDSLFFDTIFSVQDLSLLLMAAGVHERGLRVKFESWLWNDGAEKSQGEHRMTSLTTSSGGGLGDRILLFVWLVMLVRPVGEKTTGFLVFVSSLLFVFLFVW